MLGLCVELGSIGIAKTIIATRFTFKMREVLG